MSLQENDGKQNKKDSSDCFSRSSKMKSLKKKTLVAKVIMIFDCREQSRKSGDDIMEPQREEVKVD